MAIPLWGSIVEALVGKVAPAVAEHYRQKQEQKHQIEMEKLRGKMEWEKAKTMRAEASEGRDHDWEMQAMRLHSKGWKDDAVLVAVMYPLVLSFVPGFSQHATAGFAVLAQTPEWYRWLVLAIFTAIYGIRIWRRQV